MPIVTRPRSRLGWWAGGTAILVAALSAADHAGRLLARPADDMDDYHGVHAVVVRVIDGDTIDIERSDDPRGGPPTRVRLWGLDCPERARPDRPGERWAEQSAARTRALALGRVVTLELEPQRTRGAHGRLLAHVALPDGSSLNETLLDEGLAVADDRWPHTRLSRYARIEQRAQAQGVGVWEEAEARRD